MCTGLGNRLSARKAVGWGGAGGMPGLRSVSNTFQRGETGECCIPEGGTSVNKCGYCLLQLPAWGPQPILYSFLITQCI